MKLVYFGQEAWEEAYIKDKLPGLDIVFTLGAVQDSAGDAEAEMLCTFVNGHVDAAVFDKYPKLKLIATRSTGFDHIDLAEAKARGIAVASVPSYGVNTVAEFAFALILALSRRVCEAHEQVSETGSFSQERLTGFDLQGKTIGIVGGGHIGMYAIKIANGFGMRVVVFDAHRDEALAKNNNFSYATLEELLAESDIITLHVPYNEHTHHLINLQNISLIKKGAYLINTARGAVVETEAIIAALKSGTLAGAGLDVLEEEGDMSDELALLSGPHPKEEELKVVLENHYLINHPRVIITPHIAFDTNEAVRRILDTTIENIAGFEKGEPKNIVAL
ncbi:MAG TPA: NAD(P)-dependent oxidoreductase [Candidatus Paceibacterota bacterium]|jgi:D-lactate dehydrogenase|nr:NAD(P)-dependent oxidoreductase [Candidatus Paceibacterota bacterium]